jgi:hypothetical protein
VFTLTELDSGVDFSNLENIGQSFTKTEYGTSIDFYPSGDLGTTTIVYSGFGESGFGEGPFGGGVKTIINNSTSWTNIDTP